MGEIADSMINGEFDMYTGEYLGKPVGYPRTHDKSLPWENKPTGNMAYRGVINYLKLNNFKKHNDRYNIIKEYCREYEKNL